jgi:Ni/Co efflux regulator RcnB
MKRLVLFVVALVFAFCTTVMAAGDMKAPAAAPETTPLMEKAAPTKVEKVKKEKKMKKMKKMKKEMKKEEKKDMAPAETPAK